MQPRIDIHGVSKLFTKSNSFAGNFASIYRALLPGGSKVAVDNVSLTIGYGERIGIVGRNGAGKSTLLHMIAGLSSPSSGEIQTIGKITSILTLGVGLREDLTGRENIYIDAEIQGKERAAVALAIDEIIAFADIGEFIDYPVRTYSTGMKARLAFSMIAHVDPEILIIDEALSVGDAAFATKATQRIREICARGKIVIVVSHSMQAIENICNRCLWMEAGRVVMDGSPEQVTKAYIQAVREEDEAQLLGKFRELIGLRSFRAGWNIRRLEMYSGAGATPRNLLEVGERVRFALHTESDAGFQGSSVRFRIFRLDGLPVFDETFPGQDYVQEDGSLGMEVAMEPLVLGTGIYRLDVSLGVDAGVVAEASGIFEVRTSNAPPGGKPTLLYPMNVSAQGA